jgi:hypothetical protein
MMRSPLSHRRTERKAKSRLPRTTPGSPSGPEHLPTKPAHDSPGFQYRRIHIDGSLHSFATTDQLRVSAQGQLATGPGGWSEAINSRRKSLPQKRCDGAVPVRDPIIGPGGQRPAVASIVELALKPEGLALVAKSCLMVVTSSAHSAGLPPLMQHRVRCFVHHGGNKVLGMTDQFRTYPDLMRLPAPLLPT